MKRGAIRPLTAVERAALSAGLAEALDHAGVEPLIVARPTLGARVSSLWRGSVPIMVWGDRIYWPGALGDFAAHPAKMALLQHELQHVLEFAAGDLHPLAYALNPRNWTYAYQPRPEARWSDFGAEQRAQIVEDMWRLEQGVGSGRAPLAWYRGLVPWVIA